MPRPLEGESQNALMLSACARLAPGLYLTPLGDVATEFELVLIVDAFRLLDAEGAYLSPGEVPALPVGASRTLSVSWSLGYRHFFLILPIYLIWQLTKRVRARHGVSASFFVQAVGGRLTPRGSFAGMTGFAERLKMIVRRRQRARP